MPLPDFTSPATFPSFSTCPDTSSTPSQDAPQHFLLGQIGENMTITRPTLVLTDRAGDSFAMMFGGQINLAARGLKKGNTAVVPGARRKPPKKEGGNGFISVDPEMFDSVKALPGGLERVFEIGARMKEAERADRCTACGKEGGKRGLLKCSRCGGVRYCGKVSRSVCGDVKEYANGGTGLSD
jgi:hypothetical protein